MRFAHICHVLALYTGADMRTYMYIQKYDCYFDLHSCFVGRKTTVSVIVLATLRGTQTQTSAIMNLQPVKHHITQKLSRLACSRYNKFTADASIRGFGAGGQCCSSMTCVFKVCCRGQTGQNKRITNSAEAQACLADPSCCVSACIEGTW